MPVAGNVAPGVRGFALRNEPFQGKARRDVAALLVPNRRAENWSTVITPPEVKAAMGLGWDGGLHVRPRLDAIASFPQLPVNEQARGGLPPGVLRRVRAHIDTNLEANIDLAALAAVANLSRCHFARAFKQSVGAAQRPSHANGSREKHIWIAQVCLVCLRVAIGSCVRGDNDYRSDVAPWPMTFGKLKPLMEGGEKPPNYFYLRMRRLFLAHKHERTTWMPATIPGSSPGAGMTREM